MLNFKDKLRVLLDEFLRERNAKDGAYAERNKLVAVLTVFAMREGWRVGRGMHDPTDASWEPEWRNLVFNQVGLFESLPWYPDAWDGHSSPEKYRRLNALDCWLKAEAEKAEAEREAKKVTPIRPAVTVEEREEAEP